MNTINKALGRSAIMTITGFLSYQGGKYVCDKLLKQGNASKEKKDTIQTALEWTMPLVSLIPFAVPAMPLLSSLALGAGTGVATSLINYAREKFGTLKQHKDKKTGGTAPDHINVPDNTKLPPDINPPVQPPVQPTVQPPVQPPVQPNAQPRQDAKTGDYSCKPQTETEKDHIPWKGGNPDFKYTKINLPLTSSSKEEIHAKTMAEFAAKASDDAILEVWEAIKNALPNEDIIDTHGAHMYFKIYKGRFHADIRVHKNGKNKISLDPPKRCNLYKKSQGHIQTNSKGKINREHKDGFTQFIALKKKHGTNGQNGDDWIETTEDLICPTVPQNDNRNLDHYQDLSTFLKHASDDKKIRLFKRCASAITKGEGSKKDAQVCFHLGNLRSQPYLHAHIVNPNRDYLKGK